MGLAFISAAPVLDPILFGALWLIVGPKVAVIYVIVTFTAALLLALTAQRVGIERQLKPISEHAPVRHALAVGASTTTGGNDNVFPSRSIRTTAERTPRDHALSGTVIGTTATVADHRR